MLLKRKVARKHRDFLNDSINIPLVVSTDNETAFKGCHLCDECINGVFFDVRGFTSVINARMRDFLERSWAHHLMSSSAFISILIGCFEHTNQKQMSHRNKEEDDD